MKLPDHEENESHQKKSKTIKIIIIALGIVAMLIPLYFIWADLSTAQAENEELVMASNTIIDAVALVGTSSVQTVALAQQEAEREAAAKLAAELEAAAKLAAEMEEEEEPEPEPEDNYIGVAYLTFDDGPWRSITTGILDLLAEEEIIATFFPLPRSDSDDIFQRYIDDGHEIANHSNSHNFNRLYSRGINTFTDDILTAHNFILDNFGYTMTSFRFPGGSMSWSRAGVEERIAALEDLGYIYFDWDIDSGDAGPASVDKSASALATRVLNGTGGKEHVVILMHDHRWRETTLEALPQIISGLRQQGYRFDILRNHPDHATE